MARATILRYRRAICLHCEADLAPFNGVSTRCAVCGAVMTRTDLDTYRTLAPLARRRERTLKVALAGAIGVGAFFILSAPYRPGDRSLAAAFVALILAAVVVHDTITLTTRRTSRWNPTIVYPAALAAAGLLPFLVGMHSALVAAAWIAASGLLMWMLTARVKRDAAGGQGNSRI